MSSTVRPVCVRRTRVRNHSALWLWMPILATGTILGGLLVSLPWQLS